MAENPLLPNAELRALHALLERASTEAIPEPERAKRRPKAGAAHGSAALLAATLLQLRGGDLLVPGVHQAATAQALLVPSTGKRTSPQPDLHVFHGDSARLLLTAGLASGLRRAAQGGLVLAFCQTGSPEPHWAEALKWAQTELLPLVLVCADPSGTEAFRSTPEANPETLEWRSFQRTAGKLKLPILSVDGQDAVAMYRVMQESALRARSGGGPAVLWAVLPAAEGPRTRSKSSSPLARLEHYMETRKIAWS